MYKVSVVGIDNTGKTSVVNHVRGMDDVSTIHLTSCENNDSSLGKKIGKSLSSVVEFSESRDLRIITGATYFLHLIPYAMEQRIKSSPVLVSDRDPMIDTLSHAEIYLPNGIPNSVRHPLRASLEYIFGRPNAVIYLDVSPEVSVQRNGLVVQIHEKVESLTRLKDSIGCELDRLSDLNVDIHTIDTESNSLNDVKGLVKSTLITIIKKNCP